MALSSTDLEAWMAYFKLLEEIRRSSSLDLEEL
jgi:hypothetical protein